MIVEERDFAGALERLSRCDRLSVDLETTGLSPYRGDVMIGVAIYAPELGESFYFPYRHRAREVPGENLPWRLWAPLRTLLSRRDCAYTYFNGKFDLQFLALDGVPLPPAGRFEDVMLAAHLLNEDEPSFGLKKLGDKYLGYHASEEEDLVNKKLRANGWGKGDLWRLPAAEVGPYAEQDARMTWELREFYRAPLKRWEVPPHNQWTLWGQVNDYSLAITRMEMRGLQLDVPGIEMYDRQAREMADHFEGELCRLAGRRVNPRSSKQLQELTGLHSTAVAVLRRISDQERGVGVGRLHQYSQPEEEWPTRNQEERYIGSLGELADTILSYRAWSKVSNTYYRPFLDFRDGADVLHPNLNIHGTVSGRMSCNKPNLQAVPRATDVYKVKDVVTARPGHSMVSVDFAQAEMRLAIHYCLRLCEEFDIKNPGVERMRQMFLRGINVHQGTADLMHSDYDTAKRINFGVIYGIGAPGLSNKMNIPFPEAQAHLRRYHSVYPEFRFLYKISEARAKKQHYINMWTGRQRHYRGYPEHKAMSNLIQGGVAEIMRVAITELDRRLPEVGAHMLHQIHDDVILEVRDDNYQEAVHMIRGVMTDPNLFPFDPPVDVDVKIGKRWGHVQKYTSEWVPGKEEELQLANTRR